MSDQPLIAIDVVPFSFSTAHGLLVGTAARAFDPFAGRQALPGVLLGAGETLSGAARRALSVKAGIELAPHHLPTQLHAFDGPSRDPRRSAISVAFIVVVAPGSGDNTLWTSTFKAPFELPFDHDLIVDVARERLRTMLWRDQGTSAALSGPVFDSGTAAKLTEAVNGTRPHAPNLHRMLSKHPQLERLEQASINGRGRPAAVWRWRKVDSAGSRLDLI